MRKISKISKSNSVPQASRAAQAHPRQPSPRNVEVHDHVRLLNQSQEEVALRYGLTQARVSQICTQVQDWREWVDERPAGQPSLDERRRIARRLFRRNYEQIYALVIKNLAANPQDRQLLKLAEQMLRKLCELCALDGDPLPGKRTGPPDGATAGKPAAAGELPNITYIESGLCSLPHQLVGELRISATAAQDQTCGEPTDAPGGHYAELEAKKSCGA